MSIRHRDLDVNSRLTSTKTFIPGKYEINIQCVKIMVQASSCTNNRYRALVAWREVDPNMLQVFYEGETDFANLRLSRPNIVTW